MPNILDFEIGDAGTGLIGDLWGRVRGTLGDIVEDAGDSLSEEIHNKLVSERRNSDYYEREPSDAEEEGEGEKVKTESSKSVSEVLSDNKDLLVKSSLVGGVFVAVMIGLNFLRGKK